MKIIDWEDFKTEALIRSKKVECLKSTYHRGIPFRRLYRRLQQNNITVIEFVQLNECVTSLCNLEISKF